MVAVHNCSVANDDIVFYEYVTATIQLMVTSIQHHMSTTEWQHWQGDGRCHRLHCVELCSCWRLYFYLAQLKLQSFQPLGQHVAVKLAPSCVNVLRLPVLYHLQPYLHVSRQLETAYIRTDCNTTPHLHSRFTATFQNNTYQNVKPFWM